MRLESVGVKRFRSIESLHLKDCGGLNVMIGRNNSGKSNILASINAFSEFVRVSGIINLNYRPPRSIDFFKNNVDAPIEISLVFSVILRERDALIQDIVNEAPQMKNAVEGLDPSLRLSATLTLSTKPRPFGYISKIALGGTVRTGSSRPDPETILLKLNADSAGELYSNENKCKIGMQNSEYINNVYQRIDEDDWKRLQNEKDPSFLFRYISRSGDPTARLMPTPEVITIVRRIFDETFSYLDFQRGLQTAVSTETANAESVRKTPLRNKVETFSGEESAVPFYVNNLLERFSQHKVLYLTDRRTPIGRDEAERLLTLKKRRRGLEQLRNIQDTVAALLGVKIDAFEPDEPSQYRERHAERPTAELDVDDFLVEVNGSGIREALRLILDVEFGRPNIVLVPNQA